MVYYFIACAYVRTYVNVCNEAWLHNDEEI